MRENRKKQRFQLHEFVLRDHVHLIITPAPSASLEKTIQFIKGGFSYRAKKEAAFHGEIWQKGFNERRIKDELEYQQQAEYIRMNPVQARFVERAQDYPYSSASLKAEIDPAPLQFRRSS